MCNMTYSYVSRVLFTYATWLHYSSHDSVVCDTRHAILWHDAWHDSFIRVTWHETLNVWHDLWHETSNVWHGSCVCTTWWSLVCDTTHLYMRHDSFTYDMPRVWHEVLICVNEACHIWIIVVSHQWVMSRMNQWVMSHMNAYIRMNHIFCVISQQISQHMTHWCETIIIHIWHFSFVSGIAHAQ